MGPRAHAPTLEINHRPLSTPGVENQTLAVSFATLCVEARSQHDYIVPRWFHTVLLLTPVMTPPMENVARRFIALVDEFYERHVAGGQRRRAALYEILSGSGLV